jgi:hypothetical protein
VAFSRSGTYLAKSLAVGLVACALILALNERVLGAPSLVAAASSATPSPPPCDPLKPWHVRVLRGYGNYRLPKNSTYACNAQLYFQVPPKDGETASQPGPPYAAPPKQSIAASFTASGLTISYYIVQAAKPRAAVFFNGLSSNPDDQVTLYLGHPHTDPTQHLATVTADFEAFVNPAGVCYTVSTNFQQEIAHAQCSASASPNVPPTSPNCPHSGSYCWGGQLTISYDTLRLNGLMSAETASGVYSAPFLIAVGQTLWDPAPQPVRVKAGQSPGVGCVRGGNAKGTACVLYSVPSFSDEAGWLHVSVTPINDTGGQQYGVYAPTAGFSAVPHRAALSTYAGIAPQSFFSSTFGDTSGSALTVRNFSLSQVLPKDVYPSTKSYTCVTCSSFQTDQWSVNVKPTLTTASVFGYDFSSFGVDNEPFAFDAVSYPVDAGAKASGGSDYLTINALAMRGTTSTDAFASDTAVILNVPFEQGPNALSASLYHVAANRSETATTPAMQTVDTDATLSYINTNESYALDKGEVTGTAYITSALFRYGTQYLFDGQRFDGAVSETIRPGNFQNAAPKDVWTLNFAAGYRSVGENYQPIDGDFNPTLGLHGWYGEAQYSQPQGARFPSTIGVLFHQFYGNGEFRDSALGMSFSRQFGHWSPFSLVGSFNTAQLTASQVARQVKYTTPLTPDQGAAYLPNSSYSASLLYKPSTSLEASFGYSSGYTQNCSSTLIPLPCYAYLQPSVIGSAYVLFPANIFLSGSIRSQNNIASGTPWGNEIGTFTKELTTANHIARSAGVGYILPKGLPCSTVAFTTINRSGTPDAFAANPPVPGYTNTYSLNIAPTTVVPVGFLLAYSRLGTDAMPPNPATLTSQFLVRLLFGVPPNSFAMQSQVPCQ